MCLLLFICSIFFSSFFYVLKVLFFTSFFFTLYLVLLHSSVFYFIPNICCHRINTETVYVSVLALRNPQFHNLNELVTFQCSIIRFCYRITYVHLTRFDGVRCAWPVLLWKRYSSVGGLHLDY